MEKSGPDTSGDGFQWVQWIAQSENKGYRMEFMQNVLYSRRLQMIIVWFPKCMCTSVRDLFLRIQMVFNPNLANETFVSDPHQVHTRKRFQYMNPEETPVRHVIMVVRNPYHRMISTFFDKHVMKRQWHYLNLHNYRKFRIWLDVHNLPHTFVQYIRFVTEHHFLDIHDLPMVYQVPVPVLADPLLGTVRFHMFSMDDPNWARGFINLVGHIAETEKIQGDKIHRLKRVLSQRVVEKRNSLPRHPAGVVDHDMVFRNTTWWNHRSQQYGFPHNFEWINSFPETIRQAMRTLYRKDIEILTFLKKYHGTPHSKIPWPAPPSENIWYIRQSKHVENIETHRDT